MWCPTHHKERQFSSTEAKDSKSPWTVDCSKPMVISDRAQRHFDKTKCRYHLSANIAKQMCLKSSRPPQFCSLVYIQYNTWNKKKGKMGKDCPPHSPFFAHLTSASCDKCSQVLRVFLCSSNFMYYIECKPKNIKGRGLGTSCKMKGTI